MTRMTIREFWENQSTSLHRSDTKEFYRQKAKEHISVIRERDRKLPTIDVGCGAGELLEFLKEAIQIEEAIDYSAKILQEASKLNPDIKFVEADFEEYLSQCNFPVWMATGSINQYINADGQVRILDYFAKNPSCKCIYFFDNVEPARYLLKQGSHILDYTSEKSLSRLRVFYAILRLSFAAIFTFNSFDIMTLNKSMGYAYSPRFWRKECKQKNLNVEVISSKYYEYRYHLIITKQ